MMNNWGKTYAQIQRMVSLPQPSNILFVSPRSQERLILSALQLGHNVSILQQLRTSATFFISIDDFSPVQGLEQIDMFPLDRNQF